MNVVRAHQGRVLASQHFGNPEELEEIGFLTLRFAEMEELIALYCETLLLRPELGGFFAPSKVVLKKQFSDKLALFKHLVIACGILYDIDVQRFEETAVTLKNVGEDRNTIIHGMLTHNETGKPSFSGHGRNIQADVETLRKLTHAVHNAELQFINTFSEFYTKLVAKRLTHSEVEAAAQGTFAPAIAILESSNKLRNDRLKARALEADLNAERGKAIQSHEALKRAKQELRNA